MSPAPEQDQQTKNPSGKDASPPDGIALYCNVAFYTAVWWIFALLVIYVLKHVEHKAMLAACSNVFVATPLTAFVLLARREALIADRSNWARMALTSTLAGFERNFTSLSLYYISADLKTVLHAFNVPFVFLISVVMGVDQRGRNCLFNCECQGTGLLSLALALLVAGALGASIFGKPHEEPGVKQSGSNFFAGVMMNVGSGLFYSMKLSLLKLLLKDGGRQDGGSEKQMSKMQLALVMNFWTGLIGLCFVPFLEATAGFSLPPLEESILMGVGIMAMLLCQLKLVELTSPLTMGVLQALHNVYIVLYFTLCDDESMPALVYGGFACSTVGAMVYAWHCERERQRNKSARARSLTELLVPSPPAKV